MRGMSGLRRMADAGLTTLTLAMALALAGCGDREPAATVTDLTDDLGGSQIGDDVADTAPEEDAGPPLSDVALDPEPPPEASDRCGDVPVDGRCEGDVVAYCESVETGVARKPCPEGQECAMVDGYADCRNLGSAGCGRVTWDGFCEGTVAVYCDGDATAVVRHDCADDGTTCGFVDDATGFWCLPRPTGEGAMTARGSFWFEKPAVTPAGLGEVSELPARRARVQLRRADDDVLIASGVTDDTGAFAIRFDDPGVDVYALAMTFVDDDRNAIAVRDCPRADCEDAGYVHAVFSEAMAPAGQLDFGGWVATREGSAAAFNIFDVFLRGQDFATEVFGVRPPPLTGQWEDGSATICDALSCFSDRDDTIYVLGLAADGDAFDDPVLAHEFGHYLEAVFSRSDSPGGAHDGTPTDPRLAWGEGYGTWAGCELLDSPRYIDTFATGAMVIDVSATGVRASRQGGLTQLLSEYVVAEALWTLSRGAGAISPLGGAAVFDAMRGWFTASGFRDRGVRGLDFVDFLDGIMCRSTSREATVRATVVDRLRFPYDFGGPARCP